MRCLECGCHDFFDCKLIKYANKYNVKPEKFNGAKHSRNNENKPSLIIRNVDKCILCGLCVRVCDEAMGNTALGLIGRGFDTVVSPEFGLPLEKRIALLRSVRGCLSDGCNYRKAAVCQKPYR